MDENQFRKNIYFVCSYRTALKENLQNGSLVLCRVNVVKDKVYVIYGDRIAFSVYWLGHGINDQVSLDRSGAGTKDFYVLQIVHTASKVSPAF